MPYRRRLGLLALSTALPLVLVAMAAARAEDIKLDEITVSSPSPIVARPTGPVTGAGSAFPTGVLPVVTNTFSPVTVVTQQQIARDQPRTLGDALFDRPGISSTTYAPGAASRPIIRGLDNARVRIQENGIVNGGVSDLGEDHTVPVNPLVADRLEVIRGPATLRYGSGAIGGVVSAENNRVPTYIPANGYAGQVTSGYSTVDNGRLGAATVDAGKDGFAVHADGFKTANDSYAIPGGIQRNSYSESQGGSIGVSAIGDRGFVGVAGVASQQSVEGFLVSTNQKRERALVALRGLTREHLVGWRRRGHCACSVRFLTTVSSKRAACCGVSTARMAITC